MNLSLQDQLRREVEYLIRDRITQWAEYELEKTLLPELIAEIQERIVVKTLAMCDKYSGLKLDVILRPRINNDQKTNSKKSE